MKESITKFDLEAAFKALDEISVPTAEKGIKANKPALTEIFSRKSKFDALFEEYYDIGSTEELSGAKEAREAEIAKAKLARIEKIVDLEAESPDDLLTSYVGKLIMQCPQCMTLFYKDPEDIEESEDDPEIVNVNEVCQHCGNESGYTLIGKVGAAEQDTEAPVDENEIPEETTEDEEADIDAEESTEETETEADDFDLDSELAVLDLDIEEEEDTDTNEAFYNEAIGAESLTEDLTEDLPEDLTEASEVDTSAEEFEKLINTPEFKKPISDNEVRAMMQELNDKETDAAVSEDLQEGVFDKLSKAAGAILDKLKTRESKADWILKNALEDYNEAELTSNGEINTKDQNRKFKTFMIIGYANELTDGTAITEAPAYSNPKLKMGMRYPEVRDNYKEADKLAKGWSLQQNNGPAFIYLAKDKNDSDVAVLCGYYKGQLFDDKVEDYFKDLKLDIEGSKLIQKSGGLTNQSDTETTPVAKLKQGMTIKLDDGEVGEIVEVTTSRLNAKSLSVKIKLEDNSVETFSLAPEAELDVFKSSLKNESFEKDLTFMSNVEELQEASLEKLISNSLIEAYRNVKGFNLTNCAYLNETFTLDGTIYFNSGNTRKTTYKFTEAHNHKDDKVELRGLNEKLGLDKQFTLIGNIDTNTKTFVAESFYCTK